MASQHPGELPQGFETGVGGVPEPLVEVAFGPSGTGEFPELAEGLLEQVSTIDLQVWMFELR